MALVKHESSYIIEPYHIVSYDCRKENGDLPQIIIGKKCSIALNCTFTLANHLTEIFSTYPSSTNLFWHQNGNPNGYSKGDIIIKNDVWIGVNCTILDGITIGNGAVIGAGSVVTKDVPPYAIVGGNPAKVIKYRFTKDIIDEIENIQFWDMDINEINNFNIHTKNINKLLMQVKEYKLSLIENAKV
jgi:virginiamycin A acetyltransferase